METKCIKDVDEETWKEFKALAAKNNLRMPILLKIMVDNFEKNSTGFWDSILNSGKILSDKEADKMEETIKKMRKERGFRDDISF